MRMYLLTSTSPFLIKEAQPIGQLKSEQSPAFRSALSASERYMNLSVLHHEVLLALQSGRLCVVLPASQQGPPKGILLGSSPGGGAFYIEPPSAVPLNNDLAAARGEAAAAEENVLWQLTGRVIDDLEDLQASLDMVGLWFFTT